jgi:glycosyltransferase involved in cell wall biosynthesis
MNKKNSPLISVIMPVYNGERFLKNAVESILKQTYAEFELIIIDDGSADDTPGIIDQYVKSDPRVKPIRHILNKGIVESRNEGFANIALNAEYIAIMDSDDISHPERLRHQIEFLEGNAEYALVGGHTNIIDEYGNLCGIRKYPLTHENILRVIAREDPFAQPAVMFRREILRTCGNYIKKYEPAEDYDLWFRIIDKYKVANLDEIVLDYRLGSTQTKTTRLKTALYNTIRIQKRWLFDRRYFSFMNLLNFTAEHLLMVMPNDLVLWLFKRLKYPKK